MRWSGEVLPEPAMIPDLGIFLRSTSMHVQPVTAKERDHARSARNDEVREALFTQAREKFPARLKLPFLLAPPGENKALKADQQSVPVTARLDGR